MPAHPERFFADRFGLNAGAMERLLGSTLTGRVDHADLFLEYRISEELVLEEGSVKKAARHVSQGAGVRAQSGERTGYAHTDDLALPNLEEAARQARAIADRSSASAVGAMGHDGPPPDRYRLAEPPTLWRAGGAATRREPRSQAGAPRPDGRGRPRARPARAPSDRHPGQRGRGGRHGYAVRVDGRRRAAAHAAQRHRDRGGRSQARDRRLPRARGRGHSISSWSRTAGSIT